MNSTRSWKKPTPDQVSQAVLQLGQDAHYRYFFDRLQNPEWIEPLWQRGYFRKPPEPIRDEAQGTIRFPQWSEGQYLARMAEHNPVLVRDVIAKVPDCGNPFVYENFADAMLRMPGDVAATLLGRAKAWSRSEYFPTFFAEKLGEVAAHLARSGETDAALELMAALLEVQPDPKSKEAIDDPDSFILAPEPRARFDLWHYQEILKKHVPAIVVACGLNVLQMLCELLDSSIRLSHRRLENEGPQDLSHIWRPAVEEDDQNRLPLIKSLLVSAVRDAAEQIVRGDPALLPPVVEKLEAQRPRWRIFTRIAMHILGSFPDKSASIGLIRQYLTDTSLFDDLDCRHEYVFLLRRYFNCLAPDEQNKLLAWAENAPSAEQFKKWLSEFRGQPASDEDAARARKHEQRDRFARFGDNLPEPGKSRYEGLVREVGDARHPEFASYTESFVGPRSPKELRDLKSMGMTERVEFLRNWQPSPDFMGPSREGLAQQLTSLVAEYPDTFAKEAPLFLGLHPTYVRAVVHGLRDAIGKKKSFEWKPVVDLCQWVLQQNDQGVPRRSAYWAEEDQDWSWTRSAIAHLLEVALAQQPNVLPFELRAEIWELLSKLTEDPNPTPEHEARYGGPNMDPSHLSINTTRGEAMHAVIRYAFWVRRHLGNAYRSFADMPEVGDVLEKHLRCEIDPSLAIRSVYGRWFRWMHVLDPDWACKQAQVIFPSDTESKAFWEAAWSSYLAFGDATDEMLSTLESQYRLAIERLGEPLLLDARPANPETQLAAHLMAFYWRGKLNLDESGGLLSRFFAKSDGNVRACAIETVGRWAWQIKQSEKNVEGQVVERLVKLWEWRVAVIKRGRDPGKDAK
jgi:hypothetical protein